MASSPWRKHNSFIRNTGFAISIVGAGLLGVLLVFLGFQIGAIISLLVGVLGFALTLILSKRKAKSMTRILKFNYQEIERDFRIVFKDNHIRFIRRMDDDSYRYEFPGYRLSMTVQPYTVHSYNYAIDRQVTKQPTTAVTLAELSAKNEAFAEKLAEAIDEMAKRRASKQNKS